MLHNLIWFSHRNITNKKYFQLRLIEASTTTYLVQKNHISNNVQIKILLEAILFQTDFNTFSSLNC